MKKITKNRLDYRILAIAFGFICSLGAAEQDFVLRSTVRVQDQVAQGKNPLLIRSMQGNFHGVVLFSHDGKQIVSGGGESVKVWDAETGTCEQEFSVDGNDAYGGTVSSIAVSSNGLYIAAGLRATVFTHRPGIKIFNTVLGRCEKTLPETSNDVCALVFSPDGTCLFSGENTGQIRVWNIETGEPDMILVGHKSSIRSLALSSDGALLVSGADDGLIKIWDTASGECVKTLENGVLVGSVGLSADGEHIVSCDRYSAIKIWDVGTGVHIRTLDNEHHLYKVLFSPDGTYVLGSGSTSNCIKIWDVETGQLRKTIGNSNAKTILSLAYSPYGEYIVSVDCGGTITLWKNPLPPDRSWIWERKFRDLWNFVD